MTQDDWSHWGDSNSRPSDYESDALPAKPQWRHVSHYDELIKRIGEHRNRSHSVAGFIRAPIISHYNRRL